MDKDALKWKGNVRSKYPIIEPCSCGKKPVLKLNACDYGIDNEYAVFCKCGKRSCIAYEPETAIKLWNEKVLF